MQARALPRCTGSCHQGRANCTCTTSTTCGQPQPAEACTELGADTAPTPPGLLARAIRRVRVTHLRWQIACLTAEREHYDALGWVGAIYLRESYAQQRQLMSRIARLQSPPAAAPRPAWHRTLGTVLAAVASAAALVLAACGGGGSDEEPQPQPQVDCKAKPEQCK